MVSQLTRSEGNIKIWSLLGSGDTRRIEAMLRLYAELVPQYAHYLPRMRERAEWGEERRPGHVVHYWLLEVDGEPAALHTFRYVRERHVGLSHALAVKPAYRKVYTCWQPLSMFLLSASLDQVREYRTLHPEYAGLRAVQVGPLDPAWRDGAERVAAQVAARLDSVTTQSRNSLRLRFYATGPALARLLDRLAGERWKADLVREDRTVQEELAAVTGYGVREARLIAAARARFDWPALSQSSAATIASLESLRQAQRDSILAAPGIELVIDASAVGGMGMCGIDPQNLLQAGQGVLLHRRWVRPCVGKALDAEFTTPVVQDQRAGTVRAVIGEETTLRWSATSGIGIDF